jgi:chromate transporter
VTSAVLGSALTTWVTFVPPMLLILAGAPFIEQLRANKRLSGALAAITAAVVGVVLNLTVWFAMHVLVDWLSVTLALVAAFFAFVLKRGLIELVLIMAALGIAVRLLL